MKFLSNYTVYCAYRILKVFGLLTFFWPISCNSRVKQFIVDTIFIVVVINNFFVLSCLVLRILSLKTITPDFTNYIFQVIIFMEASFNLLYSKFREIQFKTVFRKLTIYLNETTRREKDILNKYMFKRMPVDTYLIIIYFLACDAFILGPLFIKNKQFPLDLLYPFPIESKGTIAILYIHQIFITLQTFILIIFDFTARLLIWTFAARFELLQNDFQFIDSEKRLKLIIKKHQILLRETEEAVNFAKYVAFKVFSAVTVIIISSTIQIIHHSSSTVIVQFFLVINIASLRTVTYCWDADDLMKKSADLAWYIYKCAWIEQSNRIRTDVLIIIQRCQKPIVVKISGFIPKLSFNFCISYFYMVYSAFMALRALI